jgi:hypothetical protein
MLSSIVNTHSTIAKKIVPLQEISGSKLQADSNAIPLVFHEVHIFSYIQ